MFKFLLFEYLDNKMHIDIKETIKKYFLVRMKEAYEVALSLEPTLSLKKILAESWLLQMVTSGCC